MKLASSTIARLFGMGVAVIVMGSTQPVLAEKVLRVIPHADLKNLDPIWTTAYISRNHGYMIYDTLFAMDEQFQPQPQMVGEWSVSEDRLTWTFVLRDGLKWHDGKPVTAEDCIASLKRWGARDGMGQLLMSVVASLEAPDDRTIVMKLSEPYGLVLESIGKISSNVPFMMPKRVAETDPFQQIQEYVGSGPYVFKADEWVPGAKVVYEKNPDYVPRSEPPSAAAGGKIAKVDRVEWLYFPDQTTALNALLAGEVDIFEQPANDLVPLLESNPDVVVDVVNPVGNIGFLRFNHLHPPFDKVEIRRAVLMSIKQEDYMAAAVGDPKYWRTCYSVYPCGTPYENDAGSDILQVGDLEKAKAALQAAGYDGTPVVILHPTDIPLLSAFTQVTADRLRRIGMNVDVQAMDWSTLTSRRAKREAPAEGGWHIFHTWWIGADVIDPTAIAFSGNPDKGWFGWPADQELEQARAAFARAQSLDERKMWARKAQERLLAIAASGHIGQFFTPVAYRKDVTGLIRSPVFFLWNVDKP